MLHKGEMVIPAKQAAEIRSILDTSGSVSGSVIPPDAGFMSNPVGKNMEALIQAEIQGGITRQAGVALATYIVGTVLSGGTLAIPGIIGSAGLGASKGSLKGAAWSIADYFGFTEAGQIAAFRDSLGMDRVENISRSWDAFRSDIWNQQQDASGILGDGTVSQSVADAWGDYGSTDWSGGSDISGGGYGSDGYGDQTSGFGPGWKYGGISRGPTSGYRTTLHGDEAVVPLPNGRSIPVDMKGSGGRNVLHFHFPNALVVDKRSVDELAELIYPRLDKLAAWGH
jgi:hypothetical protein